jgi:hypothetical protein
MSQGGLRLRGAIRQPLAGRAVDNHDDNIRLGLPLFGFQ